MCTKKSHPVMSAIFFMETRKLVLLPLSPISVEEPIQLWGLDFIEEINSNSSCQHKYILTTTYYFTKWFDTIPTG